MIRPFILVNMAITADGKTASADQRISSFGSPADHRQLYRLRGTVDAILCGAGTLRAGEVLLDAGGAGHRAARRRRGLSPNPIRILVSGSGNLPGDAAVFKYPGSPIFILSREDLPESRADAMKRLPATWLPMGRQEIDWERALRYFKQELKIHRLLCEGGGTLNDALFQRDLVDELNLTVCPCVLGGRGSSTISDGIGHAHLGDATRWELQKKSLRQGDLFLTYKRLHKPTSSPIPSL